MLQKCKALVPPLKTQGKKTRLVSWLLQIAGKTEFVIEPFCGSAVFSLNMNAKSTWLNDINPHVTRFYADLQNNVINPETIKSFLEREGEELADKGAIYYLSRRKDFNFEPSSLLYLFLNRSCFNGLTRFNSSGGFNTPFCKKPDRFSKAYITKIVNQAKVMADFLRGKVRITAGDFTASILNAPENSLVYCDPPYIGVNTGYFTPWTQADQDRFFEACGKCHGHVMVSSWLSNGSRENPESERWGKAGFKIFKKEHEWIVGPKTENRPKVIEAVFRNF